jgi:hypothetical protein
MKGNGVVLLDSYRLTQYAESVSCYICGSGNNFDSELCRHCYAPMALAHQAASQRICPKMVAAIGPSGAGKTVYLGMLTDMLSRQTEPMQLLRVGRFPLRSNKRRWPPWPAASFRKRRPTSPTAGTGSTARSSASTSGRPS